MHLSHKKMSFSLKMSSFGGLSCCCGCEMPILDRYFTCIGAQTWHQECLRCAACRLQLTERCYERQGQHFCRNDFISPSCPTCGQAIMPTDLVRHAGPVAFHTGCFCCSICSRCLATGDEYRPLGDGQQVICLEHEASLGRLRPEDFGVPRSPPGTKTSLGEEVEEAKNDDLSQPKSDVFYEQHNDETFRTADGENSSNFIDFPLNDDADKAAASGDSPLYSNTLDLLDDQSEDGLEDTASLLDKGLDDGTVGSPNSETNLRTSQTREDGGSLQTKRRGPRTTIKAKQLDTLKQAFATTPKPTRHIREQLAHETGLTMRVIQVWFQNRRSKERRMKQLSILGVRRPSFRHHACRRMRPGLRDGSGGLVAEDIPPELMAELLNIHPGYPGIYCSDAQREFYKAMVTEGASMGPSAYAYGPSPAQPHFPGFPPAVGGGGPLLAMPPLLDSYEPRQASPSSPQEQRSGSHVGEGRFMLTLKSSKCDVGATQSCMDNGYPPEKMCTSPDSFNALFLEPSPIENPLLTAGVDQTHQHPSEAASHLLSIKTETTNAEQHMLECSW